MKYRYLDGNIYIGKAKRAILIEMSQGCIRKDSDLIKHFSNVVLSRIGVRLKPDVTLDDIFEVMETLGIIQEVEGVNESVTML